MRGLLQIFELRERSRKAVISIAISLLILGSFSMFAVPAFAQGYNNWDKSWSEVPNEGVTDTAPAAVLFNNMVYLFTKGIGDKAIYVRTYASGNWNSAPTPVPNEGVTDVSPAAVTFNNKLYLFTKGIGDKAIYVRTMDASGNWNNGPAPVPNEGVTDVSPAAVTFNNKLYLFTKGIGDKAIYVRTMDASGNWNSGPTQVPNEGVTDVAPAAASFNNMLYLFTKGIGDKAVYVRTMDASGNWNSAPTQVPGGGTTDAALAAVAWPLDNYGPHLYLFAKGIGDKGVYFNTMDTSGKWGGWNQVPWGGTTDAALAAFDNGMCLKVLRKGIDQHIYQIQVCHVVG
jgi:hypothetical protein